MAKAVVGEIQAGRIVPDKEGGAYLPARFASAAWLERVYITYRSEGSLIVFFPTGGCRSSNTGYIYSSTPLSGNSIKLNCGWSDMIDIPLIRQVEPHWWYTHGECSQT
jgi:hypothetical protein